MNVYLTLKQAREIESALANIQTHFTVCDTKRTKWEDEAIFRLRMRLIEAIKGIEERRAEMGMPR